MRQAIKSAWGFRKGARAMSDDYAKKVKEFQKVLKEMANEATLPFLYLDADRVLEAVTETFKPSDLWPDRIREALEQAWTWGQEGRPLPDMD